MRENKNNKTGNKSRNKKVDITFLKFEMQILTQHMHLCFFF